MDDEAGVLKEIELRLEGLHFQNTLEEYMLSQLLWEAFYTRHAFIQWRLAQPPRGLSTAEWVEEYVRVVPPCDRRDKYGVPLPALDVLKELPGRLNHVRAVATSQYPCVCRVCTGFREAAGAGDTWMSVDGCY